MEDVKLELIRISNELSILASKIEVNSILLYSNAEIAKRVVSRLLQEYPDYANDKLVTYHEYFYSSNRPISDEPTWTTLYATINKILNRLGYKKTYGNGKKMLIPYSILKVWDEEYFSERQSKKTF